MAISPDGELPFPAGHPPVLLPLPKGLLQDLPIIIAPAELRKCKAWRPHSTPTSKIPPLSYSSRGGSILVRSQEHSRHSETQTLPPKASGSLLSCDWLTPSSSANMQVLPEVKRPQITLVAHFSPFGTCQPPNQDWQLRAEAVWHTAV